MTYANPATIKITGLPLEEIIGLPFLPLFVESVMGQIANTIREVLNEK